MRLENAVAANVLERILSAYGFTMQKELSDKLGIAKSNVASWLQRGQVPGNVLVQCALDTGADIQWLVTGVFANANLSNENSILHPRKSLTTSIISGKLLIERMLHSGGKTVLERILKAYGFNTQKQLSDYLGISTGTISTWIRRKYFPSEVVIACSLDTGASLYWLATGTIGYSSKDISESSVSILKMSITSGILKEMGTWISDLTFLPENHHDLRYIEKNRNSWIVDFSKNTFENGKALISVDDIHDIYDVARLPGRRLLLSGANSKFECGINEVLCVGVVIKTIIGK
ncbi:phage repressor protein CI [Rahnella sp. PAMC 25559]|uniref:phage repressor protein CI n=1 Tax=Rahnella sp. PAMC 25559 TaxID=3423225 RepID=UPI003D671D35